MCTIRANLASKMCPPRSKLRVFTPVGFHSCVVSVSFYTVAQALNLVQNKTKIVDHFKLR